MKKIGLLLLLIIANSFCVLAELTLGEVTRFTQKIQDAPDDKSLRNAVAEFKGAIENDIEEQLKTGDALVFKFYNKTYYNLLNEVLRENYDLELDFLPVKLSLTDRQDYAVALVEASDEVSLPIIWDFSGTDIDMEGAKTIGVFSHFDERLKGLILSRTLMGDEAIVEIGAGLKGHTSLNMLDLSSCDIGPEGAKFLAKNLEGTKTLEKLDLSQNHIKARGAKAWGEFLKTNTSLLELYLDGNMISDKGAAKLWEALSINNSLGVLVLSGNRIRLEQERSREALKKGLMANTSLTSLDLSNNAMHDKLNVVCEALMYNTSLTKLNLQSICAGVESVYPMECLLRVKSSLTELNLSHNQFNLGNIVDFSKASTSLTKLDWSDQMRY